MQDSTIADVVELLQATTYHGFPVVTDAREMFVVGMCTRLDLATALETALNDRTRKYTGATLCSFSSSTQKRTNTDALDLQALVDQTPIMLSEDTPFERMNRVFSSMVLC